MIYCILKGGLGNMLFQIAAAKSIAIDTNNDCSFPNLISHLQYLNSDNTYNPNLTHSHEYMQIFKNLKHSPITHNLNEYVYLMEFPFEFVEPKDIKQHTLINGFFQSEKYFKHNREAILDYLDFSFISKDYISEKYDFINTVRTTSIHVRRGDYVNHPNHHPTQSIEYYMKGVDIVKSETDLFVIFSDDIEWCKKNLKLEKVLYIEGEKDYIELYLMSLCDNNIISNSSFSWWGAWLNKNPMKKVIGPLKWFGAAIQHNTGDILPENWIKI